MKHKLELSFGSDPELHIEDQESGRIASSILVLGETKLNPIDLGDGMAMYADNVCCECRIPPSDSTEETTNRLKEVFTRMATYLGPRYRLVPKSAHIYDEDQLVKFPHPTLLNPKDGTPYVMDPWEFGCDPNFDVYTEKERKVPVPTNGLRTGSFHIHIGDKNICVEGSRLDGMTNKMIAIRLMDLFVGCASVVLDQDKTSMMRRKLYGKAGEFRPTPYGIEYRVLGNWFLSCPETTKIVLDVAEYAMRVVESDLALDYLHAIPESSIKDAINHNNSILAKNILHEAELPSALFKRVLADYTKEVKKGWGI